jgi:hypothetical protein
MAEEAKPEAPKPAAAPTPTIEQQNFLKEVRARLDAALVPEVGFPSDWSGSGQTISACPDLSCRT